MISAEGYYNMHQRSVVEFVKMQVVELEVVELKIEELG